MDVYVLRKRRRSAKEQITRRKPKQEQVGGGSRRVHGKRGEKDFAVLVNCLSNPKDSRDIKV